MNLLIDKGVVCDLVRFDDAFSLIVPPFLLQLFQLFALKQFKYGQVDSTPVHHQATKSTVIIQV